MIFRVNIVCLVGAVMGLAALLLPWVTITSFETYDTNFRADEYLATTDQIGTDDFILWLVVGAYAFIAGTALAFSSPLGGILQGVGIAMTYIGGYTVGEHAYFGDVYESSYDITIGPGTGLYLATASAILVLVSLAKPIFVGTKRHPIQKDTRFIALNWSRK